MSDWHFGMDYDMWLYPPVDWTSPDYNYELPEPIEAANIEDTLLVNAEDAIEQVRRLQAENAKLRELVRYAYECAIHSDHATCDDCRRMNSSCILADRMRELGIETGDGVS